MPIHDWSRADSGVFHDLHLVWIAALKTTLNDGLLPDPYYALAEPVLGEAIPDVIALETRGSQEGGDLPGLHSEGGAEQPVRGAPAGVLVQEMGPPDPYVGLARRIAIKDRLRGDSVVAVIELVSQGNKGSQRDRDVFVQKTVELLRRRIHVTFVDVQPHPPSLPGGFPPLLCEAFDSPPTILPPGRRLHAASYEVLESGAVQSFVVPLAPGDLLPEMPVYLLPRRFVRLPLESTYMEAFRSLPRRFREVLETR